MHTVCMAIACACMHARARAARAMRVCVARGRWRLRGPSTGLGAAPTKHAAFLVLAVRAVCEGVTDPRQDDTVPVRALHAVRTGERRARRPGHSRFCVGQPRGEQDRCRQEAAPASHAARACVHGEVGVALRRAAPSPRKPRGRGHGPAPCLRVGVTRPLFVCGQPPPPLQCHAVLHARARRWPRGTRRAVRASPCGVRVHTRVLVSGEGRSGSGLAKREGTSRSARQCDVLAPRRGVGQRGTAATGPACVRAPRLHALAPVPCPRVDEQEVLLCVGCKKRCRSSLSVQWPRRTVIGPAVEKLRSILSFHNNNNNNNRNEKGGQRSLRSPFPSSARRHRSGAKWLKERRQLVLGASRSQRRTSCCPGTCVRSLQLSDPRTPAAAVP